MPRSGTMESAYPPSYEEATTKNHWSLVAGYISGVDLYAACLVSKEWHATFAPFLWGNPAGHFGDRVYGKTAPCAPSPPSRARLIALLQLL